MTQLYEQLEDLVQKKTVYYGQLIDLMNEEWRCIGENALEKLEAQWGRLGNTPFALEEVTANLDGGLMLPVSELNRMRREMVSGLEVARSQPIAWQHHEQAQYFDLLPEPMAADQLGASDLKGFVRRGGWLCHGFAPLQEW